MQHLELGDNGIGGQALGRKVLGGHILVEPFMLRDVQVLVIDELAEIEQGCFGKLFGRHLGLALY